MRDFQSTQGWKHVKRVYCCQLCPFLSNVLDFVIIFACCPTVVMCYESLVSSFHRQEPYEILTCEMQ